MPKSNSEENDDDAFVGPAGGDDGDGMTIGAFIFRNLFNLVFV